MRRNRIFLHLNEPYLLFIITTYFAIPPSWSAVQVQREPVAVAGIDWCTLGWIVELHWINVMVSSAVVSIITAAIN